MDGHEEGSLRNYVNRHRRILQRVGKFENLIDKKALSDTVQSIL